MPKFMDVHHGMHGVTPEALQAAHQADLDIQGEEDVDFQRAWGDPESGMVWCISEAPNADAVKRIHERTGHPATEVYPSPSRSSGNRSERAGSSRRRRSAFELAEGQSPIRDCVEIQFGSQVDPASVEKACSKCAEARVISDQR